jgi:hypothetical protein
MRGPLRHRSWRFDFRELTAKAGGPLFFWWVLGIVGFLTETFIANIATDGDIVRRIASYHLLLSTTQETPTS